MAGEIYKNTGCIEVKGRIFEDVQGEKVAPKTAPFKDGFIPYFSAVAIDKTKDDDKPKVPEKDRLVKISDFHGRSYEVRFGEQSSVVWSDVYGNLFTAFNIKGNNLFSPDVKRSAQEPSGYQVLGLMDSDALVRILRVSRVLREHHVDTECFVKVIEPQELPYDGNLLSLEDFKGKLLHQVEQRKNGLTSGDLLPLSNHLDNSTFVIPVRSVKVPERIEDLARVNNKDEFKAMMKRIFERVNLIEQLKAERKGVPLANVFDAEKDGDIERYLLEYLPEKLGENYGGLHELGLLHVFPHAGNQTAAGEIVDLDSVKGELTGCNDPAVSEEEKKEERASVIKGLQSTLHNLEQKGILKFTLNTLQATDNYYKSYFAKRGWEKDILSHLADIDSAFGHYADPHSHPHAEYYLNLAVNQLGWDYQYNITLHEAIKDFSSKDEKSIKVGLENLLDNPGNQITADEIIEGYFTGKTKYFERDTNQRFSNYLSENIEEDLLKIHSSELEEITAKYGHETSKAVKFLFVDRAYNRLSRDRTNSLDEEISREGKQSIKSVEDKYKGQAMDYYRQAISNPEHSFDPLMPVWTICAENEFFEGNPTLRDKYLERIAQHNGWDYHHPESLEQLTQQYVRYVDTRLRAYFERGWNQNPDHSQFNTIFEQAVLETHKVYASLMPFIHEQVEDLARTIYDDKIKELTEKYGADRVQNFMWILAYREADRIGWSDKADIGTDKLVDKLHEQIKQELAAKFGNIT